MGLLSGLSRLVLGPGHRARDLLEDLTEDYRAEAAQAAHLRQHAERARYPQAAHALRRLAEIEERPESISRGGTDARVRRRVRCADGVPRPAKAGAADLTRPTAGGVVWGAGWRLEAAPRSRRRSRQVSFGLFLDHDVHVLAQDEIQ